jgi:hypothetical protein
MRLQPAYKAPLEVSSNLPPALLFVALLLTGKPCLFGEHPDHAPLPDWWHGAQAPEVRVFGEQLAQDRNSAKKALGNLMLARHHDTLGNLPRAINFIDLALKAEMPDDYCTVLATYLRASLLGRRGRIRDQRLAINRYRLASEKIGGVPPGLQSPDMMLVYNLVATGNTEGAQRHLDSLDEPADSDQLAQRLFARAVLAAESNRDPKIAWKNLESAFEALGTSASLRTFALLNAASVFSARQFLPEQAEGFAKEAIKVRPEDTAFLPEAEIARFNLELCNWEKAAEWLARAQQAKMALRPNYRQEAIKDLKFAVADFYLATGHPREARLALEALEYDFFRPGYTTGSDAYYLCGLYLRRCLALDRELELAAACWMRGTMGAKARVLPHILCLQINFLRAKMQFRDTLLRRIVNATPGTDIAMLYYGPSWLLPAMREVLGKANFASLSERFRPEGVRHDVLKPLISVLLGSNLDSVPHEPTPLLLRNTILALSPSSVGTPARIFRYSPSAFLIVGRQLPVLAPDGMPVGGWLRRRDGGLAIQSETHGNPAIVRLQLNDSGGNILRSSETAWPQSVAGRLEVLNVAFATSVFPLTNQTITKIEGRAVQFPAMSPTDH